MKKTLTVLALAGLALAAFAQEATTPRPRRTRPASFSRPTGGIVEKPATGKVLRIADTQKVLPAEKVAEIVLEMRRTALLPFEVVAAEKKSGACPMAMADELVKAEGVGAGVVVVEDEKLPWMLVAPESRWTVLNVAPLKADAPDAAKYEKRFQKVLWCAVARTLGAGYSSYAGCVLTPFATLAELDAVPVSRPCPEPFNKMIDTGARYGIQTITIASYRTACQKGWAPPPANDEQRKIWDEVRADRERGPTNPILIKPNQK